MDSRLVNIGFGNAVRVSRILAVVNPGSSPIRKLKEDARTEKKLIDVTDYNLAISEPLPARPQVLPQIAPHLVTQFYLTYPGLHSKSSIDKQLQLQADEVLKRWNNEFSQNGINNLAALMVDIEKNEVLTYS